MGSDAPIAHDPHWPVVSLKEITTKIGSGATPTGGADAYLSARTNYALVRSQNVFDRRFDPDGLAFITDEQAAGLRGVVLQPNDILLNITGDGVTFGRACLVSDSILPACVNQHVSIVRVDPHRAEAGYVLAFLTHPDVKPYIESFNAGGSRRAITKGHIESFRLPLPPLAEQRRIADILGALDDKVELNRQMSQTLESMARALFRSWFVDFDPVRAKAEGRDPGIQGHLSTLFPDALVDSELGPIPEGWHVEALGSHVAVERGISYGGAGLGSGDLPMHNLNSIYEGGGYKDGGIKFYAGEFRPRHVAQPGDLIVANTEQGHRRLLIGCAAIVPRRYPNGLFSHHLYRVNIVGVAPFSPEFLCALLNSDVMHETVSGYANGTTVNMLPMAGLQRPLVCVPPEGLVQAFTSFDKEVRLRCETQREADGTLEFAARRASAESRLRRLDAQGTSLQCGGAVGMNSGTDESRDRVSPRWSVGSQWHRWDPHIHAPGTLRNDQFGNDWTGYFQRIAEAQPAPVALGITDYFTLCCYNEFVRLRPPSLASVGLVFPNVELRLTIETRRGQGINIHLLVCPDDPDHSAMMGSKLARLGFRYREESFPCTEAGLQKLGRVYTGNRALSDDAALREGSNQFKVDFNELRSLFEQDAWMRQNVLVAVAAGNDGLGGLAADGGFRALREELGRFADIIFSGQPGDRIYWLGKHPDFEANGQTPKPCLQGSDAHGLDAVLRPDSDRFTWIRGEPTFDALRQALVEPERRAYVGDAPPSGPVASSVIRSLSLRNATWLENETLPLNPGLVTVIGARGSGKTALADLVAFAAGADEAQPGPASFIEKAGHLLDGLETQLHWDDDSQQSSVLPRDWLDEGEPRAQYLSQQFVERLCDPSDLAEPLVAEIERVVFSAIPEENRLGCSSFSELRDLVLENVLADREFEQRVIAGKSKAVADETALFRSLPVLRAKLAETERALAGLVKELAGLPAKVDDKKVKAYQAALAKLSALKETIAAQERRAQDIGDVAAELQRQVRSSVAIWQELRAKHPGLLEPVVWESLKPGIADEALALLRRLQAEALARVVALRDQGIPLVGPDGASVATQGLAALDAECERLGKELGLNQANVGRRVGLETRQATARIEVDKAKAEVTRAEAAPARGKLARADRLASYEKVFKSLVEEEEALRRIYAPLRQRLQEDKRLSKLAFDVHRVVNLNEWVRRGEALLDLRKPPFAGRGVLEDKAREELLQAWSEGSPGQARLAMEKFLEKYAAAALDSLAQGRTPLEFGDWAFSTRDIRVEYGIQYEDVDIENLSPGTRGVVLLTLYLGLDTWDLRPLIIDQPEENLDPSSVYSELVPFFRDAATRRQIIMVTHNANLVVNTDSDQVVVAEAHRSTPKGLPHIVYTAGGLEDAKIRGDVCRLLEGGREAFLRRGQRYGVMSKKGPVAVAAGTSSSGGTTV